MSVSVSMLDAVACCYNRKGYDIIFQTNSYRTISSASRQSPHYLNVSPACSHLVHVRSLSVHPRINYRFPYRKRNCFKGTALSPYYAKFRIHASLDVASAVDVINDLGLDTLTFLAVTVLVVPGFKMIKASPLFQILGFFFAGVVLNQLGLIRNITDVKILSEWGILFLLFEMGLELSLARLKALAKFAFGLGLSQVLLSTLAFTAFELPPNGAIGTKILEFLFHSRPDLVNIRSIDEAVVIGAALSLSSSAFVLQLLAEKGELPTRFGSATLGILLLQDIAVVPLLVILPVLESQNLVEESIWPMLAKESLKALGGLGLLSLGGKYLLRRVFEVVAETRSSEAFVALCLLTVAGTSLITQKLGFSDTLGAFLAGALLAETNFRTQIEADIRPFRGLLLGLFFVTTGTSIDMQLLIREWPNVFSLLAGLIVIKTLIITAIGPRVGLSLQESIRIGLLLSQGGEFGFVVFSLANRLGVLPLELNKLLIIVVVLSMALTPLLNDVGRKVADYIGERFEDKTTPDDSVNFDASEPVVIVGFGQKAQVLANFLSTPLVVGSDNRDVGWPYVAFDLDPSVVKTSRKLGFPVLYGDGSRPAVLQSAGINSPKAVMVMYTGKTRTIEAVQRIRLAFPAIPIYARAKDMMHLLDLKKAGATDALLENAETSLQLGSKLLKGLGVMSDEVSFLSQIVRDSMEIQAQEALVRADEQDLNVMKPLQVKASDLVRAYTPSNDEDNNTSNLPAGDDDGELSLKEEEARGVLYCEIGPDSNNNIKSRTDVRNPVDWTSVSPLLTQRLTQPPYHLCHPKGPVGQTTVTLVTMPNYGMTHLPSIEVSTPRDDPVALFAGVWRSKGKGLPCADSGKGKCRFKQRQKLACGLKRRRRQRSLVCRFKADIGPLIRHVSSDPVLRKIVSSSVVYGNGDWI
ncbi:k(+) efflux antiporter 3 chloroplastic [Phtheirospermum japonicum]|uniref:K(+) efflux antiporter 3 chloroplastic n=1 Tax=Phtheirospermum japonicum TaxID=374723 RepID=A0A830BQQ8_9LAMI|nr:k(+) efflux antiporter 3 chloroplastic [Phtheirospermum japonicum]